jgi:hypothetical protein
MNKLKIAPLYYVKGNNSNKTEKKTTHAKFQVHSFTAMLIIVPEDLIDSNSSTQGTNNTT